MSEREPTPDELKAMAYVDGELAPEERALFEVRIREDQALAREVAELTKLGLLARQTTPLEPMDHEWERMEGELLQGDGTWVAFAATCLGAFGLLAWIGYKLITCQLDTLPKLCLCLLWFGLTVVFLLVLRARRRTLPFDPYTEIKR